MISGTRSGSGKIVFEFYDKLVLLWGGSANATPLTCGIGSDDLEYESDGEQLQDTLNEQDFDDFSNAITLPLEISVSSLPEESYNTEETRASSATSAMSSKKRKASCVPQVIDNKKESI